MYTKAKDIPLAFLFGLDIRRVKIFFVTLAYNKGKQVFVYQGQTYDMMSFRLT